MSAVPLFSSIQKSTNVRSLKEGAERRSAPDTPGEAGAAMVGLPAAGLARAPLALRLAAATIRALEGFAPRVAGRLAGRLFLTPPRTRASSRAMALFELASRRDLAIGGARIAVWSWGEGPAIYLVHGWAGRATQLRAFVEPLLGAGFRVIAFDQAAHGASSGRTASLAGFARTIAGVVEGMGAPAHAIVAHSLGAAAALLAIENGLPVERAVLIAPPSNPREASRRFARFMGYGESTRERMERDIERRIGMPWTAVDPLARPEKARTFVRIYHDPADGEVPFAEAEALVVGLPSADLVALPGAGHGRILHDSRAVAGALAFIGRAHGERCSCSACSLDRELFERDRRATVAGHAMAG